MVSKQDIENALNDVVSKFDDPNIKSGFANYTKNIQFDFTDLNTSYLIKVENGEVKSNAEESMENPDILVKVESTDFIDILAKKMNPMKAYTTGKLKAKGKLTDLLKIQKLL